MQVPQVGFRQNRKITRNNQGDNNEGNDHSGQNGGNNDNHSWDPEGRDTTKDKYTKGHIDIQHTQGIGESIRNICKRYGIQTHFKGIRTIKNILVNSKDKEPFYKKSGVIYWYQCGELMCHDGYIGETSRTLGERYNEHLKQPSPIFECCNISGHSTNPDNFTIIGREDHGLSRSIKRIYLH